MKILFFCANFFPAARSGVAQIFNLLHRRIAFGWVPDAAQASEPVAATALQIRDTAEFNSALLRLRLCRAVCAIFSNQRLRFQHFPVTYPLLPPRNLVP